VTLQAADKGDTTTMDATLIEAGMAVAELVVEQAESLHAGSGLLRRAHSVATSV
jgi:hypothetical protein